MRVDDAQQRKEVCEKLVKLDYIAINMAESIDSNYIFAFDGWVSRLYGKGFRGEQGRKELESSGFIDCGTNEALFLALAGMRSDTDSRQFFKKGSYLYKADEQGNLTIPFVHYYGSTPTTRATAAEIIEWHKQKGETK